MSTRKRMFELMTPQEVDAFLQRFPTGVIFKAGSCHKTMQGFSIVEAAIAPYLDLHLGFIRVVENRPASNHVAERTGIVHESPQFILFVEGEAVFDLDNWEITPEALEPALRQHLGEGADVELESAATDLSPYCDLLKQFLGDELTEPEFRDQWIATFKMDASPRTQREVALLNGLYGDPFPTASIRERAQELLEAMS